MLDVAQQEVHVDSPGPRVHVDRLVIPVVIRR